MAEGKKKEEPLVPFRYRDDVASVYVAFGDAPVSAETLRSIHQLLPKFSDQLLLKYVDLCPLDKTQLMNFIGEGRRETDGNFEDLLWSIVEGLARQNFFGGSADAEANCDTKELRATLDPKIRPVKLNIASVFSEKTSNGERTTIRELMEVFKSIFPKGQNSFLDLINFARATRPKKKSIASDEASPSTGKAEAPKAEKVEPSVAAPVKQETASSPKGEEPHAATNVESVPSHSAADGVPAGVDAGSPGGEAVFTSIRERFGSTIKHVARVNSAVNAFSEHHAAPAVSVSSPPAGPVAQPVAPPTGPLVTQSHIDHEPPSGALMDEQSKPPTSQRSATPQNKVHPREEERPLPADPPPRVVKDDDSFKAYLESLDRVAAGNAPEHAKSQSPPQGEGDQQQSPPPAVPSLSSPPPSVPPANAIPPAVTSLREPPPLPPNVRSAVLGMRANNNSGSMQGMPQNTESAPRFVNSMGREVLSLRQIQQLPKEVVEFIQQLDHQRAQLQDQLQQELDELTANNAVISTMRERLERLRVIQATPIFQPLEEERQDLIHRMDQWLFATRAGKEAARGELSKLRNAKLSDAAAEAVYRHSLGNEVSPATTAVPTSGATAAAMTALHAFNDPTPRLARFFESLSNKEKEIRLQETALDKMRLIEKREKRILNEIAKLESSHQQSTVSAQQAPGMSESPEHPAQAQQRRVEEARDIRDQYYTANQLAPASLSRYQFEQSLQAPDRPGSKVFRMDPAKPALSSPLQFTPVVAPFGAERRQPMGQNPYLSKNIAEHSRPSLDATNNITRRLEEHILKRR